MAKNKICCFCRAPLKDREANNAEPIRANGVCCDRCNADIVIPYRILMANASTVHTIGKENEV